MDEGKIIKEYKCRECGEEYKTEWGQMYCENSHRVMRMLSPQAMISHTLKTLIKKVEDINYRRKKEYPYPQN